jgi:predicted acetyltransferase
MAKEQPRLIDPTPELEAAYRQMMADFAAAGEPRRAHDLDEFGDNFAAFVASRRAMATQTDLPPNLVNQSTYWLVRGKCILGTCHFRPRLNAKLEHEGGHVGYAIRPTERRQGYATRLLALALDKARERGLRRVLLTCDKDNVPSARVIVKNGGRLEDERISKESGKTIQRYWIELSRTTE